MKKLSVSWILFICLILSIIYAAFAIAYKVKYYGFTIYPKKSNDVWLIEAAISYKPNGKPIKISLSTPKNNSILGEIINTDNYIITEKKFKTKKIIELSSDKKTTDIERIYYKLLILDNPEINEYFSSDYGKKVKIEKPYFDESQMKSAEALLKLSKELAAKEDVLYIGKLIELLNQKPAIDEVKTFLPLKVSQREIYDIAKNLLALDNIAVRMIRGVKLVEGKTAQTPDLLLEAFINNEWVVFNLENGKIGVPKNFLVFQNGGDSLLDVVGGTDSKITFSVIKNHYNSEFLAKYKANLNSSHKLFNYSVYNLPVDEQSIFKFMLVFPLAILAIVILKNIVGIKTLGTFTPMLVAMSFIQTGLISGLIAFIILISIGLLFRYFLSKLNLLLVPRISSVVILVIFMMQIIAVLSYNFNIEQGLSIIFFPLIITAWIIERSSIIIEENGEKEAIKQNITTLIVSVLTYMVISSEKTRYVMYVFNELNLVILFLVMLIGTYTGYKLTELFRFKPLLNGNKND